MAKGDASEAGSVGNPPPHSASCAREDAQNGVAEAEGETDMTRY